ncbi:hypothetical protein AGLY_002899 [Aphis glycines]|uniref:Uncharacterized protein n=1 Tax=Aphis glycines TaxID=307491 RepID=A0A6G0U1J6_APHGL|nr:hypothetical protein AGLY_002899 [Aphis glycines]
MNRHIYEYKVIFNMLFFNKSKSIYQKNEKKRYSRSKLNENMEHIMSLKEHTTYARSNRLFYNSQARKYLYYLKIPLKCFVNIVKTIKVCAIKLHSMYNEPKRNSEFKCISNTDLSKSMNRSCQASNRLRSFQRVTICNPKTKHCKYLKFTPNVYNSVIFTEYVKIAKICNLKFIKMFVFITKRKLEASLKEKCDECLNFNFFIKSCNDITIYPQTIFNICYYTKSISFRYLKRSPVTIRLAFSLHDLIFKIFCLFKGYL